MTEYALPLEATDAPNLFVTVNAWTSTGVTTAWQSQSSHRLRSATTEIAVEPINKLLTVTILPNKEQVGPRDEVLFTMRVVDQSGVPVRAELSLSLVDEAIYELSEDLTSPLYKSFYGARLQRIATLDSFSPLRTFGDYGRGGGGGGGGFSPENPRQFFPDTAFWAPALVTDDNGEVTAKVSLPDSITAWRAVVKAITAESQVGEATASLSTTQALTVEPLLPNALTVGDEGLVSLLIHNGTMSTETVTVTLTLSPTTPTDGLDEPTSLRLNDDSTKRVLVAPGHSAVAGWRVVAVAAGEPQLTFAATTAQFSDAVRVPLVIQPQAIRHVTTTVGDFTTTWTKTIDLSENLAELNLVRLELSRSPAGSMMEGLEYLTGYPYGCVEQTMSSALPNAVVGRAFRQLGIGDPTLQRQLPELINIGLQRLYAFQDSSGGWGWWENDGANGYQTAWVVFGLAQTLEAGYEVDEQVLARGNDYLRQHLPEFDQRSQAFALYVLSLLDSRQSTETMERLTSQAEQLDPFSLAALALAWHRFAEDTTAEALLALITARAIESDEGIYWSVNNGDGDSDGVYERKSMASATRSTALVLSALLAIRPDDEQIPAIVQWLMAQRRAQGWGTTNETAFTLLALTDYLFVTTVEKAPTPYTISLNGSTIATGTIDQIKPSVQITLTAEELYCDCDERRRFDPESDGDSRSVQNGVAQNGALGTNMLQITTDKDERLYYRLVQQSYETEAFRQPAGKIIVGRRYVHPQSGEPMTTVTVGELVQVQLTVQLPEAQSYMLVEDHLPGGLMALNEQLVSERYQTITARDPNYQNSAEGPYTHKEIRGSRVTFFFTEVTEGNWQITYYARAITPGFFLAPPAEAYAMYDLERWGRSAGEQLQVLAE